MIEELKKPPKSWLTRPLCKKLFGKFKQDLEFDEPIPPFETRFPGILEGILESIRQTFGGKLLNPTVLDAAVAYFFQLLMGHPFQNGKKRIAVLFTHWFILYHSLDFKLTQKELFSLAIGVVETSKDYPDGTIKRAIEVIFSETIVKHL